MLPRAYRLTRSEQFRATIKNGRRAGGRLLVTHWAADDVDGLQVGFVVSRAVGGSVVRNRVKRRLRELCADRIQAGLTGLPQKGLPETGSLVVRALPGAGRADSASLGRELDSCLGRVLA